MEEKGRSAPRICPLLDGEMGETTFTAPKTQRVRRVLFLPRLEIMVVMFSFRPVLLVSSLGDEITLFLAVRLGCLG